MSLDVDQTVKITCAKPLLADPGGAEFTGGVFSQVSRPEYFRKGTRGKEAQKDSADTKTQNRKSELSWTEAMS